MAKRNELRTRLLAAIVGVLLTIATSARAVDIQNICRIKGQEPIRLQGLGLVVGLNGTGDTRYAPLQAALAQANSRFGSGVTDLSQLIAARSAALVFVQCTIPGVGGREGDRFDCFVSVQGTAKSLAGGRLLTTPLKGPFINEETFFALAEGPISVESPQDATTGRIEEGAQLTEDFFAPFLRGQDLITLVIDNAHAGFVTADRIAQEINNRLQPQLDRRRGGQPGVPVARALDGKNVVVRIPSFATGGARSASQLDDIPIDDADVVRFIADIMSISLADETVHTEARVVINERSGTIVVTGEVKLTPVLVAQRNLVVLPPGIIPVGQAPVNDFTPLTSAGPPPSPIPLPIPLNDLLTALNRAQASAADKIAIIKELDKTGKLHARVIFE